MRTRAHIDFPYPIAVIPARQDLPEPVYWRWLPPSEEDRERARTDRWGPVKDEEMIAFRVLERWCRYRCGICGQSDHRYRIVMDHDHSTGLCRGMLCNECNRREGFGGGRLFDMYREWPPASVCEVKVGYWPASVWPASPELLAFQEELRVSRWLCKGRLSRRRAPWLAAELGIASRDDLTAAEIAEILGRAESAVTARRRSLTLGPPDLDAWL